MNSVMMMEYNFLNGKPRSRMILHLDVIFQETEDKLKYKINTIKLIKLILKNGSQENIDQVHEFLKEYSPLWLQEFEKIKQ
jgi:hypothetical protein